MAYFVFTFNIMQKTWFDTARFGLFIHWGHSSQQGWELSWPLVGGVFSLPYCQNIEVEAYHQNAYTFDPHDYNPHIWARLATQLGMQYAILTVKHHDGFALFHTQQSEFSIQHTPYQQDIVRSFLDAMRAQGLRVGLYFSLSDWHHPDYPAFTEADKPYRFDRLPQPTPQQWQRYLAFLFAQLRELLTNYGEIDVLWFDGGWERTPEQWRSSELHQMIRQLQPNCLINDRLPGFGDFDTPEQFIPAQPPARRWETCLTINESWGYNPTDRQFKTTRQLIHTLCEVAGKGGNLLLNVSPMGNGELPAEQVERLAEVSAWMNHYAESIIDTEPGLEAWQFYGSSTRRGQRYYLHLLMQPYDTLSVRGVPIKQIAAVRSLKTNQPLEYTARCSILDTLQNPDPLGELIIQVPATAIDPNATVLFIDFLPKQKA
ncbi:MAG: alpha-L-fucosidase [Xenococcaceae cyanobacterium]